MKVDFLNLPGSTLQQMIDNAPSQEEIDQAYEKLKDKYRAECIKKIHDFPWDFENFGEKELKEMESAVKHFCLNYLLSHLEDSGIEPYWLTIRGISELGKTHLTQRAVEFLKRHAEGIQYPIRGADKQRLSDSEYKFIKASKYINEASGYKSKYRSIASEPEVVVFDDVHKGMKPWEINDCCNFLMMRAGEGLLPWKWTIITTNMTREELSDNYDLRIASRIRRENNIDVELNNDTTLFKDR